MLYCWILVFYVVFIARCHFALKHKILDAAKLIGLIFVFKKLVFE